MEEIGSDAMLAAKSSAGVTPEMYIKYTPVQSANKVAHSGFETQERHHQKSITRYQWPHKRDLYPLKKFLFKK